MPRIQMTRLAEPRSILRQKLFVIRTMRLMAVQAIFANRWVLPQERPAFFRMAFIALLVYRICDDHFRRERAVRIVTARTCHEPFANRMVGRPLDLGSNIVVTSAARFFNPGSLQQLFSGFGRMHRMACDASQIMLLVYATFPVLLPTALMTPKADGRRFLRFEFFGIPDERGITRFGMRLPRAMAGFASVCGARRKSLAAMNGFFKAMRYIFMARQAGLAPRIASLILSRGRLGLRFRSYRAEIKQQQGCCDNENETLPDCRHVSSMDLTSLRLIHFP